MLEIFKCDKICMKAAVKYIILEKVRCRSEPWVTGSGRHLNVRVIKERKP